MRHLRHEFWWWAERVTGRLWFRFCRDGVSCWFDAVPSYCTRRRYAAFRALHPELFATGGR